MWLGGLPLTNDMSENDTVYGCLTGLMQMKHPDHLNNLALALAALIAGLQEESVSNGVKEALVGALQGLLADAATQQLVIAAISSLGQEAAAFLGQFVNLG